MKVRKISDDFIRDLKDRDGELNWIYKKVKAPESEYSLEIREGYINIYYRGGSLLKITEKNAKKKGHYYKFKFDKKYGYRKGGACCDFMTRSIDDIEKLTNENAQRYFDDFKNMMDDWFDEHHKKEREYQHYASLPKNNENVLDIEYAIGESGMRIDMIMIDKEGELYLIENKYGNSSISSHTRTGKVKPGLSKHYGDFIKVVTEKDHWSNIRESMKNILSIKQELGLIPPEYKLKFDKEGKPVFHMLFILADLSLSSKSTLIETERRIIIDKYTPYLKEFTPEVLCIASDQHRISLYDAEPLPAFSL